MPRREAASAARASRRRAADRARRVPAPPGKEARTREADESLLTRCPATLATLSALTATLPATLPATGADDRPAPEEAAREESSAREEDARGCARARPYVRRAPASARSHAQRSFSSSSDRILSDPRRGASARREARLADARRIFASAARESLRPRTVPSTPACAARTGTRLAPPRPTRATLERVRRLAPFLRVDRSERHGLGVFAECDIPPMETIMEYRGEIIRRVVADKRERDYAREANHPGKKKRPEKDDVGTDEKNDDGENHKSLDAATYMFGADPLFPDLVIDATRKGNATRFVNHSCDPNCATRVDRAPRPLANKRKPKGEKAAAAAAAGAKFGAKNGGGGANRARPIVTLYTLTFVPAGTELTYDYMFAPDEPGNEVACACGAEKCRGTINVKPDRSRRG